MTVATTERKILLNDILRIENPTQYKLHLACRNEEGLNPLDEYVANRSKWIGWNQWKGEKNDWTREFVLSMMDFYPRNDSWLFGGVFKVLERSGANTSSKSLPIL